MTDRSIHSRGLIVLIIAAVFIMAAVSVKDRPWTLALHAHENPTFVDFMGRTVFEGDAPGANDLVILFLLAAVVVYCLGYRRPVVKAVQAWRAQAGFVICSALFGGLYMVHALKWIVGRARPGLVLKSGWPFTQWYEFGPHYITEGIYRGSFPSGHTALACVLMALVYMLSADPVRGRRLQVLGWFIAVVAGGLSLAMGIARCMSLSHWLSDVIGAMMLGWIIMHWLYFFVLRVPDQQRYLISYGRLPEMPRFWELSLAFHGFAMTLGIVMIAMGVRSIFILHLSWLLVLVPMGAAVSWMALRGIMRLLNLLGEGLNAEHG